MYNLGIVLLRCCWAAVLLTTNHLGNTQSNAVQRGPERTVHRSIFEREISCKLTKGSLRDEDLTVLDFRIGTSTMADVQKRFPGTKPVELSSEEETERGICVKNEDGMAMVFATSVMGAPTDTLTSIYLASVRLAETHRLSCRHVNLPSKMFASKSGIRVGATADQVSKVVRAKLPREGPFCVAYEIASGQGPLQLGKDEELEGVIQFTGAAGDFAKGKLKWVSLGGITTN